MALTGTVGHVSLVGAGPGDPGLLTRTAIARLRAADLVLYDALIDPRVLKYARRAQRFFVGKRAGRHAMPQTAIHALMIRAARRGRRVVRLRGAAIHSYSVAAAKKPWRCRAPAFTYDVVPGVTSAVAAASAAGIPVTHRGLATAFLVSSGHDADAVASGSLTQPERHHGGRPDGTGTIAVIGSLLIDRGWSRGTPAAVIVDGTRPQQQVWRGTLDQLASDAFEIDGCGAGTIVIGDVVAVGLKMAHGARDVAAPRLRARS